MEHPEHQNDVYISHCDMDSEWVEEWLLPSLEAEGFSVAVNFRDFVLGMPIIENTEQAVANSYRTIVVITPDWLESKWNKFEEILVRTNDPDASKRKLLPLLLKETELKGSSLAALNTANFTNKKHWKKQLKRVIRDLRDHVPPSKVHLKTSKLSYFKHWLRYYRQPFRIGLLMLFITWVVVSTFFEVAPFQPRQGWGKISGEMRDARSVTRLGDTLFVTTRSDFKGSNSVKDTGLWMGQDEGKSWTRIVVDPLKFKHEGLGYVLSEISSMALSLGSKKSTYASTLQVGLLQNKRDKPKEWYRIGREQLPSALQSVLVSPDNPDHVFVNSRDGRLFFSKDAGENWDQVGRSCDSKGSDKTPLPASFIVYSMLAKNEKLYVGSYGQDALAYPKQTDGIYVSEDSGKCWLRLHKSEGRYEYIYLAPIPHQLGGFLAVVDDRGIKSGLANFKLFQFQKNSSEPLVLWETKREITSIFTNQNNWYIATKFGEIIKGSMSNPESTVVLPRLTHCIIPPLCNGKLTADVNSSLPPLILGKNHVYRYTKVPWFRRLWP